MKDPIKNKEIRDRLSRYSRVSGTPDLDINTMVLASFKTANDKGWHEEERTFGDLIALIHSEVSEALEDYRVGKDPKEIWLEGDKPCGIPTELADVLIRIGDLCGVYGIDLQAAVIQKMEYNATREHRHGGKKL